MIVKATLKNAGKVDTGEVVQVYIKDLESKHATTHPSLAGFKNLC